MPKELRVAIAQINPIVGDVEGNLAKHIEFATQARDELKADVVVFPELSLTGYPPEDLLLRPSFINDVNNAFNTLQNSIQNIYCIVGHPHAESRGLLNACSVIFNGTLVARNNKHHLPNYGVFDEKRYFMQGDIPNVFEIKNIPVGIIICEDLWFPKSTEHLANQGARIIFSPNASPFEIQKDVQRQKLLIKRAKTANASIVYVNQIGGQDEIIFDGGSVVVDSQGQITDQLPFFQETLRAVDIEITSTDSTQSMHPFSLLSEEEKIYKALVLAVHDYVKKNNFPGALIGSSGGIDSALTLAIAADAIGNENVIAVMMPSRYTADISNHASQELIENLGIRSETISIEPTFQSFLTSLDPIFKNKNVDVTEENIQARCRGVILMALSNKFGSLVLTSGNRSEMAVGYATLYGDMAGGFAVLKDIPKTMVYRLAKYRNSIHPVIPQSILDREPTAELAFDQKDQDTLPPYPVLDKIIYLHINQAMSGEEISNTGFDKATVEKVIKMIRLNEYKRRQAPIGPRIDHTAFGKDRRYPITSGYKK